MNKGVIFDLDGVITDTAKYHFLAWQKMANTIDINIDETFNEQLKGISRHESLNKILDFGDKKYGNEKCIELCQYKNQIYLEYLNSLDESNILPGIKKLLNNLKENEVKIGLASASLNATYILEKLNIINYFDYIADPLEATYSKPDPAIFVLAMKGLNLTNENCIGIEDSQAGVDAINGASIKCIGVGKLLKNCDIILKDTGELTYERVCELL